MPGVARRTILALTSSLALLSGCSEGHVRFPVTERAQASLPSDVQVIRLDASNISSFERPAEPHRATALPKVGRWAYRIGSGDLLGIVVFDHPELTMPAGPEAKAGENSFRVQADGTIVYPYVGSIRAEGRGPEEVREELRERLAAFVPDPQVDVRVLGFQSQAVSVTGEVETPNRQPLTTVALTLLDAINAAGGLTETADTRRVTVRRGGQSYRVDLDGFLSAGLGQNNPVLRPGDIVTVPRRRAEEAYLLGEIVKPAAVDLSLEPLTLTQALTRQGGILERRADARGVFVFRGKGGTGMTVFQLDARSPTALLLGTRFLLQPSDVVYVTRAPLSRWNDTISDLLPTVGAAGSVDRLGAN
ncbi:sugar transporter [Rhodobacter sphaeroides]|jgi:Periplasmic protein involved in polysaccharide export|uniref:Polysaccharide export protein n=1 Tax=Cereibacter sphaeroides (strain ATCC 17023 / DSM 158 / JCM 6121 / CCUG 31486 / LMG 2827 / NBRC 12203 / NCIMB 8253 / ATH 2.4.1.) TaxID=272943 RepID=Q3IV70_CERS4|nr:polysaccharide biosynthesis/export family protein [Cereibacter sphaeroides]ABA81564.1 Polysaccharide export protein [Cereibacter sphaeroides 2.4.1]AMJ50124.1 sugar ABC transporter substrate-binding protein [Cereibacter sphaeroides]ANS36746.1 sugar ABC transporter substrate-binding protein [Cereibacter sphaeroides]ATN65915.1 sugar ABC transporter substrate-binding protein [Cereibacter sphaeroides]AXC63992.1 sugar transporter [Cereibacter sphaeroides 2.4.1]